MGLPGRNLYLGKIFVLVHRHVAALREIHLLFLQKDLPLPKQPGKIPPWV